MRTDDEKIKNLIFEIVKSKKLVRSQGELVCLLKNMEIPISPKRARLLAVDKVKIRVITKRSNKKLPANCPSCLQKLKKLYAVNLANKKTLIGLACENCGYRGTPKSFSPFRYEFMLKN